jgi:hypothetical protein
MQRQPTPACKAAHPSKASLTHCIAPRVYDVAAAAAVVFAGAATLPADQAFSIYGVDAGANVQIFVSSLASAALLGKPVPHSLASPGTCCRTCQVTQCVHTRHACYEASCGVSFHTDLDVALPVCSQQF